ncbi:MAG: hypothetical protein WAM17_09840 [Rhodoplanes sp.]
MARSPALFRQRDAAALVRAVRASGLDVARVEVHGDGKLVVITGKPAPASNQAATEEEIVL